jgi:hypothetical protein
MKVLVDVGMEVNPEPIQYGDTDSDLERVKCTTCEMLGSVYMCLCVCVCTHVCASVAILSD